MILFIWHYCEMTLRGEESTHFQFWRRCQMTSKRQLPVLT